LRFSSHDVMREPDGVFTAIAAVLEERPRNHRGSPPPSPTLPARGRVPAGEYGKIEPNFTSPLAGEVAKLEAKPRSAARRGGAAPSKPADSRD
jgi:hypothetical protein